MNANIMNYWQAGYNITVYPARSKGGRVHWSQWTARRQTYPELIALLRDNPQYTNAAAIVGYNGLTVLDFDSLAEYAQFKSEYKALANTTTVLTGRGAHLWYDIAQVDNDYTHPLCEVWARSKYASLPGNIHPSGRVYREAWGLDKLLTVDAIEDLGAVIKPEPEPRNHPNFSSLQGRGQGRIVPGRGKIASIKSAFTIWDVIGDVGAIVSGCGYKVGYCPAHDDKNRSLSIDLERGRIQCLAAGCQLHTRHGSDLIDAYAILNNLSNREAIRRLYDAI